MHFHSKHLQSSSISRKDYHNVFLFVFVFLFGSSQFKTLQDTGKNTRNVSPPWLKHFKRRSTPKHLPQNSGFIGVFPRLLSRHTATDEDEVDKERRQREQRTCNPGHIAHAHGTPSGDFAFTVLALRRRSGPWHWGIAAALGYSLRRRWSSQGRDPWTWRRCSGAAEAGCPGHTPPRSPPAGLGWDLLGWGALSSGWPPRSTPGARL